MGSLAVQTVDLDGMSTDANDTNNTDDERPHAGTSYTVGTVIIITVVSATFANAMLLLALSNRPKKGPGGGGYSIIFRYSLIICDIGFSLLCLTPLVLNYMARENLIGGMCEWQAYFYAMTFGIHTWHVAFMVLNQYVLLSHQDFFAKYQTDCATAMQLFFCFTMPTILLIPGFRDTEVSYHSKRLKCSFSTDTVASVVVLDTLLSSALPGVITITSLVLTYTFLRKQRSVVWSHHSITQVSPTTDFDRRASSVTAVRFQRDELPLVKTFTLIFIRVMVGFIINISANAAQNSIEENALIVMDCIVYVAYSLDPLFFYVTQEKLRTTFKETVMCCGKEEEEVRTETPSDVVPDLVSEVGVIRGRNRAFSMAAATHGVRPSFY